MIKYVWSNYKHKYKLKGTLSLIHLLQTALVLCKFPLRILVQLFSQNASISPSPNYSAALFYPDWPVRMSDRRVTAWPDNKLQTTSF